MMEILNAKITGTNLTIMPQYMGYSLPPNNNANYAFVLSALSMIDNKAVFLLPNSAMDSSTKEEKAIRRQLIEDNLISAIIKLPDSMFESTSIPTCIIVFDKHKQTQKVEMIDATKSFDTEVRDQKGQWGGSSHENRTYHKTVKILPPRVIDKILKAINALESKEGFCYAAGINEIKAQNYSLTPTRYIEHEAFVEKHRPFEDIAEDYNRIIRQKNAISIRMNKTAAQRLGFSCMDHDRPDLSASFELVGQKCEKEAYISFGADDGIKISISTKNGVHPLIIDFLNHWKQMIIYLNNEENRILAEFRDALLPKLMSGEIEVRENEK